MIDYTTVKGPQDVRPAAERDNPNYRREGEVAKVPQPQRFDDLSKKIAQKSVAEIEWERHRPRHAEIIHRLEEIQLVDLVRLQDKRVELAELQERIPALQAQSTKQVVHMQAKVDRGAKVIAEGQAMADELKRKLDDAVQAQACTPDDFPAMIAEATELEAKASKLRNRVTEVKNAVAREGYARELLAGEQSRHAAMVASIETDKHRAEAEIIEAKRQVKALEEHIANAPDYKAEVRALREEKKHLESLIPSPR